MLSKEEQERAKGFKFALHRSRFIASHGFTRAVLARYLSIKDIDIVYNKGNHGKPYLTSINKQNIQFNLSHSHDLALLAVTQGNEVGVDIEYCQRKTDWQGIVKRFFTATEQKALFLLPEIQQREAFFQLWTRKEAYMKVLGTGLALAPTQFSLSVPPEKPCLLAHHSSQYLPLETITFNTIHLGKQFKDYCASLAVVGKHHEYCLYLYDPDNIDSKMESKIEL